MPAPGAPAPLPSAPLPPPSACAAGAAAPRPGPSPLRRLTRFEYDNTVRDLLGDTTQPARAFPPDEQALGFDNNAEARVVGSLLAEYYAGAAEDLASRHTAALLRDHACDPAALGAETCGRRFVESFGRRAFRRPLAADEVTRAMGPFAFGLKSQGYALGAELVVRFMLQAPQFIYRVELATAPAAGTAVARLDPGEIASRLSYLIWGSMPDTALFAAADSGALGRKEEVATQARRLLAEPRAAAVLRHFHEQWLELEGLEAIEKDRARFPAYTPEIARLQKREAMTFVEAVMSGTSADGGVAAFFTAPVSYMNARLAAFYGLQAPAGTAFTKVALDPARGAGILSQGGLLAHLALPDQSSPIHRGKFVREQLFCQVLPIPPADAVIVPPAPDPRKTTRERFSEHSANAACRGCHQLIDPIGLGFEAYDAVGRFRATENGKPVDTRGEIVAAEADTTGPFDGVAGLGAKLARSGEALACVGRQWFRFAQGRGEVADDACALAALAATLRSSGSVREALVALTQTDAFLTRTATPAAGGTP
jgi:hypothetical protein